VEEDQPQHFFVALLVLKDAERGLPSNLSLLPRGLSTGICTDDCINIGGPAATIIAGHVKTLVATVLCVEGEQGTRKDGIGTVDTAGGPAGAWAGLGGDVGKCTNLRPGITDMDPARGVATPL